MKPLALVLAVIFVILGVLYFMGRMPWPSLGVHAKHGIGCIIIALLCLVWYRFQSAQPAR
jgi:accessory gene regulator protein AgrB